MDDWTLLKAYAKDGDERAFATLVERHIGLVYGAAFRHLKSVGAAEEIVQMVFATLAEQAGRLKPSASLAAWLYRAACRKAIDQLRHEKARRRREHLHADEAMTHEQDANWQEIAPLLDEAMRSLKDEERTAVLMRVFEERPLTEVGKALGVSDDTARKRVASALERLRKWFERRGVRCTSAALGLAIGTFAAAPAASGLIQSTIQGALAHAVATASATTTTSTILTTMASMKLPLVCGLLVGTAVPISLGYLQERKAPSTSATIQPKSLPNKTPRSKSVLTGLMAEWAQLRAEYGPNGGSMAQLYDVVSKLDDDFRRRMFRTALVAEWAMLDPEAALAHFKQAKDSRRMTDVVRVWLENDPDKAIAAMKADGEDLKDPISRLLTEIATSHPGELANLASLTSGDRVANAFALAARKDLASMREVAFGMDGKARIEALAGVAEAWAERNAADALVWVQALESSEDRSRALRQVLVGWAATDPAAALDNLDIAPPGGVRSGFVHELGTSEVVLSAAAEADFEATLAWLDKNPDVFSKGSISGLKNPLRDRLMADVPGTLTMVRDHNASALLTKTLEHLLSNEAGGRLAEVWEWARSEPQSEFANALKHDLSKSVLLENSDNALGFAKELIADGDLESLDLETLANMLVKHPDDLQKHSDVFNLAPQEVRDNALLRSLTRDDAPALDNEVWLGWAEKLPREKRYEAVFHQAAKLVTTDPANGIAWADSLPPMEKVVAYEGLSMIWSRADSYETSQWIATLPEGAPRDSATGALVSVIAASEPDSAWEWARTIQDPPHRKKALQQVLQQLGTSASSILEKAGLPADETAQLQTWITNQHPNPNP